MGKKISENYDVVIPFVPQGGNCSLETASDPILRMVEEYIEQHPTNPLHLIGSSNGARIASYMETSLRATHPNTKIRVTSLCGPHGGSDLMKWAKYTGFFHPDLVEDMTPGSKRSQKRVEEMSKPCDNRFYEFFATPHDLVIPNFYTSCFPILMGKNVKNYLCFSTDHLLIGHHMAEKIMRDSREWFQ